MPTILIRMNPYSKVLAAAKKVARDVARSRWIMNLLEDRKTLEMENKEIVKEMETPAKRLEVAEFKLSQGEKLSDPRVEDYKEIVKETKKEVEEVEKSMKSRTEANDKEIVKIDKEIADIASGEKKVNRSKMISRAKELVAARYQEDFINSKITEEEK